MGCLAGPVLVAIAVFEEGPPPFPGLDDSKKLSPSRRRQLYWKIFDEAVTIGLGFSTNEVVDQHGIREAWNRAASMAAEGLEHTPDKTYIDGHIEPRVAKVLGNSITMPKADSKIWQVSAASIVAKVIRDDWMSSLAKEYPGYGFEKHKGYGTELHRSAIMERGFSPLHRRSFCRKIRPHGFGGGAAE